MSSNPGPPPASRPIGYSIRISVQAEARISNGQISSDNVASFTTALAARISDGLAYFTAIVTGGLIGLVCPATLITTGTAFPVTIPDGTTALI